MRDPDVPFEHSIALARHLEGDVRMTLVKNGDHRLSTPADLIVLERELALLLQEIEP
jgi:hypothetical protein